MQVTQINLRHFFDLLSEMTGKELKVRYKHTLFGFLWVFINPLLQMIVIGFIFTFFIKHTIEHYFFFLFIGLLVWNFFSISLTKATPSIVYERSLIKKSYFPRIVIPLSIILSMYINFILSIGLLIIAYLFVNPISIFSIFLILMATIWLLVITTGLSLIACVLNVRYRDINFFVQAILIIWFYATPIIYPMSFIPKNLTWIWFLNPLTAIVETFQFALFGKYSPILLSIIINGITAIVILITSILLFYRESKFFDDWV